MSKKNVEQKLLDCLVQWKENQAVFEGVELFQKISFLYGRLNKQTEYEEFIKSKVQMTIGLMADEQDIKIGLGLFSIGMSYPNLSDRQFEQLETLYKDGNYYDIIDFLLFDQEFLKRKLDKYDIEKRNKINHTFSKGLMDDVFEVFFVQGDDPGSVAGTILVYDRPSNEIIRVLDSRLIDFRTQKIIDFGAILENDKFIEIVSELFSEEIALNFVNWCSEKNGIHLIDDIGYCDVNYDTFKSFEQFLKNNFNSIAIADKYLAFQRKISAQWLEHANSIRK